MTSRGARDYGSGRRTHLYEQCNHPFPISSWVGQLVKFQIKIKLAHSILRNNFIAMQESFPKLNNSKLLDLYLTLSVFKRIIIGVRERALEVGQSEDNLQKPFLFPSWVPRTELRWSDLHSEHLQ